MHREPVVRKLGRVLRTGTYFLLFATLLLYFSLSWLSFALLTDVAELETENKILTIVDRLRIGLHNHDTGLRGFSISGNSKHLSFIRESEVDVTSQVTALIQLLTQPAEQQKLRELSEQLTTLFYYGRSIEAQDRTVAKASENLKQFMSKSISASTAISEIIGSFASERHRSQNVRVQQRKSRLTGFWICFAIGGLGLIASAAYFLIKIKLLVQHVSESQDQIQELANHDALTGLPNRRLLDIQADQVIARANPAHPHSVALIMLDLDGFKEINDKLGHAAGDELLIILSKRLRGALRSRETVARLGGDEFVVMVEQASSREEVLELAERLSAAVGEPVSVANETFHQGVSIGVCFHSEDTGSLASMLRCADHALYEAKRAGKGQIVTFTPTKGAAPADGIAIAGQTRRVAAGPHSISSLEG